MTVDAGGLEMRVGALTPHGGAVVVGPPPDTRAPRLRPLVARRPTVALALLVLALLALAALLAPVLSPHAPNEPLDLLNLRLQPPSRAHPFGTDQFSRDLFSRVLHGARLSLGLGLFSVLVATIAGTAVGAVAGYAGGPLDAVLMRTVDALLAVPRVLLLLVVVSLWGTLEPPALVLLLGLTGWFGVARLVRAQVRAVRTREYVLAARALGAGHARVLVRHVLPACAAPVIVAATLGIAHVIAIEAGLSYLGLGVTIPHASWGTIIHDGTDYVQSAWWISVIPGLAIVLVMLCCTIVGDALRDALDPRELSRR